MRDEAKKKIFEDFILLPTVVKLSGKEADSMTREVFSFLRNQGKKQNPCIKKAFNQTCKAQHFG